MAQAAEKIETPKTITIRSLAREALQAANGDIRAAIESMVKHLLADRRALKEVVAEAIMIASSTSAQLVHRGKRRQVFGVGQGQSTIAVLADGIRAALLDFPLAGGVLLRHASRAEVSAQANIYEEQGRVHMARARWLRLIAQSVPDDRAVGDVITDARAIELWNEAVAP